MGSLEGKSGPKDGGIGQAVRQVRDEEVTSVTEALERRVARWLEQLPGWRDVAPYGGGLSAKLFSRRLLCVRYRKAFPEPLLSGEWDRLDTWLDVRCDEIVADAQAIRSAIDRACDKAKRESACLKVNELARRLVDEAARSRLRDSGPTAMELDALADTYLDNTPAPERQLTRKRFETFAPEYDDAWSRDGAFNLLKHPYSAVLLGDDERPPFMKTQRENMWDGLGRSVYYRSQQAIQDDQVLGDAEQIVRAEIARTCGRLGLIDESALVVLYSLMMGILLATQEALEGKNNHLSRASFQPWESGEVVAADEPPVYDMPLTNQALIQFAESVMGQFCRRSKQGQYLRASSQMYRAEAHVMRRAWTDCFAEDRRGDRVTGDRAEQIIRRAIYWGIRSGERHILARSAYITVDPNDGKSTIGVPGELDLDQVNRALDWFAANPQVGIGIVNEDEECIAQYCDAIEAHGLPTLEDIKAFISKGKA